jgi:hypothetical protein
MAHNLLEEKQTVDEFHEATWFDPAQITQMPLSLPCQW